MSVESVIFFVIFVLLPLFQQWRERQKKEQERARRPKPGVTRPPAPMDVDEADEETGWEMPVERPAPPPVPVRIGRPPKPARPVRPVELVVAAPRAARVHRRQSRAAASGLASRADLRQAVIQMTVLGPCRAARPYTAD
jgi:hypothetical protein